MFTSNPVKFLKISWLFHWITSWIRRKGYAFEKEKKNIWTGHIFWPKGMIKEMKLVFDFLTFLFIEVCLCLWKLSVCNKFVTEIDTIASNNGSWWNNALCKLPFSLPPSHTKNIEMQLYLKKTMYVSLFMPFDRTLRKEQSDTKKSSFWVIFCHI